MLRNECTVKVIQLVNTLDQSDGGPARNSFELNLALNRRPAVDVDLVWIRGRMKDSVLESYRGELPTPGPRRLAWAGSTPRKTIGWISLLGSIRSADAVIVHGYYLPWVGPAALTCRLFGVPFVITPHGSLTRHQRDTSRLKKWLYEKLAGHLIRRWSAGFITGSAIEAEEARDAFPDSVAEVGGVGTSLSVPVVKPSPDREGLHLLSLSRVAPKKRLDLMIDAMAELSAQGRSAHLTVAGSGDAELLKSLRAQAQRLQVDHNIEFVGPVKGDEKEALFASTDIFLLPSDDENFGIGLAEALAHGIPSVVSDRVAASSVMSPSSGRVLTRPTGASIAEAVGDLAEILPSGVAQASARLDAETSFSWDAIAATWMDRLCAISRHPPKTDAAAVQKHQSIDSL